MFSNETNNTSKKKVKKSERSNFDFYPTPEWCVDRFVEAAKDRLEMSECFIEPSAGNGAILKALQKYKFKYATYIAVEIQTKFETELNSIPNCQTIIGDWTQLDVVEKVKKAVPFDGKWNANIVIGNPPYSKAYEFIETITKEHSPRLICLLLRLNWLASSKRNQFLSENTPDIYVLPNRPSFSYNGQTDMSDYAWFVWDRNLQQNHGNIYILKTTPTSERSKSYKNE